MGLPKPEEVDRLALPGNSVVRRVANDPRAVLAHPLVLVLQSSHPTISKGIEEHSDFDANPWDRLFGTVDFVWLLIFGTVEEAARAGANIYKMHDRFKGRPGPGYYHARQADPWTWTHMSMGWGMVKAYEEFAQPLSRGERERFLQEWKNLGRLCGVPAKEMPADWDAFEGYVDDMMRNTLKDTPTLRRMLTVIEKPKMPPGLGTWYSTYFGRGYRATTASMLPDYLQRRFNVGLDWRDRVFHLPAAHNWALWAGAAANIGWGELYYKNRRSHMQRYLTPPGTGGALGPAF